VQVIDDCGLSEDVAPVRFRPIEQVVDRDAVADERALALLLGLEPAQPVVARLPQRDAVRRKGCRRRTKHAEAGGEDDEGRPVVPSLSCFRKRFLECPQDDSIGVGMPSYPGACPRAGDLCSKRLDTAIPALLLVAPDRQRPVRHSPEEIELTVQLDVGPRLPGSCRHAHRLAWRGRQ
jgi:hypothetical protein